MKKAEAKPCPFCGWSTIEGLVDLKKGSQIRCKNCKCGTGWHKSWSEAVAAWNRRVGDGEDNA